MSVPCFLKFGVYFCLNFWIWLKQVYVYVSAAVRNLMLKMKGWKWCDSPGCKARTGNRFIGDWVVCVWCFCSVCKAIFPKNLPLK